MVPAEQCNTSGLALCNRFWTVSPPVISGDVTDPTAIGCQECEEGSCDTNPYIENSMILACGSLSPDGSQCPCCSNEYGQGDQIFNNLKIKKVNFRYIPEQLFPGPLEEWRIELTFDTESDAVRFMANYTKSNINDTTGDILGDQYIRFRKEIGVGIYYIPNVIPTRSGSIVQFSSFDEVQQLTEPVRSVKDFFDTNTEKTFINDQVKYRVRFP